MLQLTKAAAEAAIDEFLQVIIRTAVMRRAFRYAVDVLGLDNLEGVWQSELRRIWFTRAGHPCAFEHIFVGNLSEDADGHPVAGGLHCWLKFYLEELRGTAKYLGYMYNRRPKEALQDHRYISGKFTWRHAGRDLVKEEGGFFIGVSPEWLLADGTIAYLETRDEDAARHGWQPWLGARDRGYTKDVVHEGFGYRKVVCHSDDGALVTVFSSFLGTARPQGDTGYTAHLDEILPEAELSTRLPHVLVAEGVARGVSFSSSNEEFLKEKELLVRELLLATPRVTNKLLTDAAYKSFQDADAGVVSSFANRTVACCQYLYNKKQQSSSGKKLSAHTRRLISILHSPARKQASKSKPSTVVLGKFGHGQARVLKKRTTSEADQAAGDLEQLPSQSAELRALAASYGLKAVPAAAWSAARPVVVQDSGSENVLDSSEESSDPEVVASSSSKVPASSSKAASSTAAAATPKVSRVRQHECFDLNRACWVRHMQGRVLEAAMIPGENGFMLAQFPDEPAKEVELPICLWTKCLQSKEDEEAADDQEDGSGEVTTKKRPSAAIVAEEPSSEEKPHRFGYMYYSKDVSVGFCKFWRSAGKIKRQQVCNFRQQGWDEEAVREAAKTCVDALSSGALACDKPAIDAFMAKYVSDNSGD
ncbi:endou-a [Symbiodinium natans]|uniref:Endou-a protein n=1 Tax=Symbiodinium natans TaxID=878477 RepID=A0A812QK26_9DINO|nr:endou-a [Symbiodinium natans]